MSAAVQFAEVSICIVGIGHQRSLEAAKEFLYHLALPTPEKVIADLCRQVDENPHIALHIFEGAV